MRSCFGTFCYCFPKDKSKQIECKFLDLLFDWNSFHMQKRLSEALTEPLEFLFEAGGTLTWASIRSLLKRESDLATSTFSSAISGFELDQATVDRMVQNLKEYARQLVERKSREEARKVLICMKDRFH